MEPEEATDEVVSSPTGWWRRQTYSHYSYYLDDDGMIQKIFDDNNTEELPRGRAKTPPLKGALKRTSLSPQSVKNGDGRGSTPVSFPPSVRPSKYFTEGQARTGTVSNDTYGPTKLETNRFRSHSSEGETAWHFSQAPYDLDAPLPETAIPRLLGTIYVHRNVNDGGYQVWVWYKRDGNGLAWQPVDLKNEQIAHPKIADQSLKLTSTGKPSWILNSTATTYRSRTLRRSRSRSAAPSTFGKAPDGELETSVD